MKNLRKIMFIKNRFFLQTRTKRILGKNILMFNSTHSYKIISQNN